MVEAVKRNYPQREIADAAFELQEKIDAGEQVVVGVNRYTEGDDGETPILRIDPALERKQIGRVQAVRARRDGAEVERQLAELRERRGRRGEPDADPDRVRPRARDRGRDGRRAPARLGRVHRVAGVLSTLAGLPSFDPVQEAARNWAKHCGDDPVPSMAAVTSIMRVQQILLARLNDTLKPFDLTFPRYEALMLLFYSRKGALPLGKMGDRLQVHRTSVTNIIDGLERSGFVTREPHERDRRTTLAAHHRQGPRNGGRGDKGAQRDALRHRAPVQAGTRRHHRHAASPASRRRRVCVTFDFCRLGGRNFHPHSTRKAAAPSALLPSMADRLSNELA